VPQPPHHSICYTFLNSNETTTPAKPDIGYSHDISVMYAKLHIPHSNETTIPAKPDIGYSHDISVMYAKYAIIGQLGIVFQPIVPTTPSMLVTLLAPMFTYGKQELHHPI
jgi:hypothetical protein